jgi:hypothetical protein
MTNRLMNMLRQIAQSLALESSARNHVLKADGTQIRRSNGLFSSYAARQVIHVRLDYESVLGNEVVLVHRRAAR